MKFLFLACILLLGLSAGAQKRPTIQSTVTKKKILLGEPFQLVVESDIPGGSVVLPLRIDTIPHFEFLEPPASDTIREASGLRIKTVFTLTSFDSGHWVIPSYTLTGRIRTDTLGVDVVFSEFDPNQPYHDIKDVIAVEDVTAKKTWWYWVAGGAVLVIILAAVLMKRRKRPAAAEQPAGNSYEEAISALEKLKRDKPAAREYYSALVSIFRLYVLKRKGILSLQKTTDDLVIKLQALQPDKHKLEKLQQALRLSDFVKFARYQPGPSDDEEAWNAIRNGIDELEKTS